LLFCKRLQNHIQLEKTMKTRNARELSSALVLFSSGIPGILSASKDRDDMGRRNQMNRMNPRQLNQQGRNELREHVPEYPDAGLIRHYPSSMFKELRARKNFKPSACNKQTAHQLPETELLRRLNQALRKYSTTILKLPEWDDPAWTRYEEIQRERALLNFGKKPVCFDTNGKIAARRSLPETENWNDKRFYVRTLKDESMQRPYGREEVALIEKRLSKFRAWEHTYEVQEDKALNIALAEYINLHYPHFEERCKLHPDRASMEAALKDDPYPTAERPGHAATDSGDAIRNAPDDYVWTSVRNTGGTGRLKGADSEPGIRTEIIGFIEDGSHRKAKEITTKQKKSIGRKKSKTPFPDSLKAAYLKYDREAEADRPEEE